MKKSLSTLLILICFINGWAQRNLTLPEVSQSAMVMQRIGLTDITIKYHSPLANDRKIWGDLVPYNEVWRAGANENTTIDISTDVSIEGKLLKAGTYGLHMIPTEKEWTIIFSNDFKSWGSFFYNENKDALRVKVMPKQAEMQKWLSYGFADPQPSSVVTILRWEKLAVSFSIQIDVAEMVIANMKEELKNIPGFFPEGHQQAAAYCIDKKVHLNEAETWIDRSIALQKSFSNLNTKSQLLALQGKQAESDALIKEAMELADENQLNTYGYQLLGQGKKVEALEIFKLNAKRYPKSWNVFDSLAEAYEKNGDNKSALSNYKIALSKAPENQKARLQNTIKKLSNS